MGELIFVGRRLNILQLFAEFVPEIGEKVVSFLDLREQLALRLVCKLFKSTVESHWKRITCLHVYEWKPTNLEFFVQQKFDTENCILFKYDYTILPLELFWLLAKYCPNLQVLDAPEMSIFYHHLLQVKDNICYFRCKEILVEGAQEKRIVSRFGHFRRLQAFKVKSTTDETERLNSVAFAQHLVRREKPILMLENPSNDDESDDFIEDAEYLTMGPRLRGLALRYTQNNMNLHPIPPNCTNLMYLSLNFGSPSILSDQGQRLVESINGTFPSLRELQLVDTRGVYKGLFDNLSFSWPQLRKFEFEGKLNVTQVRTLFERLALLEKLEEIKCDSFGDEKAPNLAIPLPPNIERFTMKRRISELHLNPDFYEFVDTLQPSILRFHTTGLSDYYFNFPRLKEFSALLYRINKSECDLLLESLSNSPNLRTLKIEASDAPPSLFNSLYETLKSLSSLRDVHFRLREVETTQSFSQSDIKHVRRFFLGPHLTMPRGSGLRFALINEFDRVAIEPAGIQFKGQNFDYTFRGPIISLADSLPVELTSSMTKVTQFFLKMEPSRLPWFRPQNLQHFPNVKVIHNGGPFTGSSKFYRDIVAWACGLPYLVKMTSPFRREVLIDFLEKMKAKGPLELEISSLVDTRAATRNWDVLDDELHSLIHRRIDEGLIGSLKADFWPCQCSFDFYL